MDYKIIEHHISEIIKNEFDVRNQDIPLATTMVKQEMERRGMLNTLLTVSKISSFFEEEFKYRCEFIKTILLDAIPKINLKTKDDIITNIKILYQSKIKNEKDVLGSRFISESDSISRGLLSNPNEKLKQNLSDTMQRYLVKNNSIIDYEYSYAKEQQNKGNRIIFIKPEFMGAGLDVLALLKKIKS